MEGLALVLLYLAVPSLLFSVLQQALAWRKQSTASAARFPGPRQFPIVGRIHDLPRFSMWLKLKEWADLYGPIYQTSALNDTLIIISDEKIAEELLVKRGHIYSGRPQIRSLIRHKDGPTYVALQDRHDTWSRQRKWVHAAMAEAHKHHFYGHIERETARLLGLFLLDPASALTHTRDYCGRVISRLSWDDASLGPRDGDAADATLHCMSVSGPITNTATPLWHLPWPLNPWRRYEVARERELRAWWLQTFRAARERMRRGELPSDTFAHRYFSQLRRDGREVSSSNGEKDIKFSPADSSDDLAQDPAQEEFASCMVGFLNLVGVVTISGPLKFFLMAMALHPDWQRRAQEEIDRVCPDRMPTVADSPRLPTVRACLKETTRWRSGVPLGVPHQAERDDEFRGVKIKKGTIILACEWNINRVEAKYPDPESYRPERWLEPGWPTFQEPLERYPNFRDGQSMHTFGWGRRTCLGQNLVDDEALVYAASVLWAFRLTQKTCPATGRPIPIDTQATNSHVILEPDPFPLAIEPRSRQRAADILDGYKAVVGELKV